MRYFGIIGYPLVHSFSGKFFTEKFEREGIDASYLNFEVENVTRIEDILKEHPTLEGFNVTIPHKKNIIPLLDDISDEAKEIGAVNCVKVTQGKLTGYNTDVFGFRTSLLNLIGNDRPDALILGTGGASLAAQFALDKLNIEYRLVSRSRGEGNISYEELDEQIMGRYRLIVNTTPLGTFPDTSTLPDLPYDKLTDAHYLFDMVYNPPLTRFLEEGQKIGAKTTNGTEMLIVQAEKSWEIWNRP